MIPAKLTLARELEQLLHEHAPDAKDSADFAELVTPHLFVALARAMGPHAFVALATRGLEAIAKLPETPPKAPTSGILAVPCSRAGTCARGAVKERWDPLAGIWRPVCPDHFQGSSPFELRALGGEALIPCSHASCRELMFGIDWCEACGAIRISSWGAGWVLPSAARDANAPVAASPRDPKKKEPE